MEIKDIGIDDDGVLRSLDIYQYASGLQYYTGIKLSKDVLSGRFEELEELFQIFNEKYFQLYGEYPKFEELIANPTGYSMREIFGCSKLKEFTTFFLPFLKYCLLYKARKDASEYMHKWKNEGRRLHIITGRKFTSDDTFILLRNTSRWMLERRLEEDEIPFDTITYCSESLSWKDKYEAVANYNIKAMLEDKKENINALIPITNILCFDATYNKMCQGSNIYRITRGFLQADEVIQELEEKTKIKRK